MVEISIAIRTRIFSVINTVSGYGKSMQKHIQNLLCFIMYYMRQNSLYVKQNCINVISCLESHILTTEFSSMITMI